MSDKLSAEALAVLRDGCAMRYYEMFNIGSTRYVVNFHDGKSTHKDGSPFYGIRGFSNRREKDKFVRGLVKSGYIEGRI